MALTSVIAAAGALLCALAGAVQASVSAGHLPRRLQQAAPPQALPPALELTAEPIPFDWSLAPVTTPDRDAPRYQAQLDSLFAEPLSNWQVVPAVRERRSRL